MDAAIWSMMCEAEDFCHSAAGMGWLNAAKAVDDHFDDPPEGDEWTEDYAVALRGIAKAFRDAAKVAGECPT